MQQGRDLMQHGCYRRYMYRNVEDEMRLLRAIHYRTGAPVHRASRCTPPHHAESVGPYAALGRTARHGRNNHAIA